VIEVGEIIGEPMDLELEPIERKGERRAVKRFAATLVFAAVQERKLNGRFTR
jgi:hypothetical protein